VSPMVVIFGCVAFGAAFVLFIVGAYKLRQYHRWRALVRQVTPHKQGALPANQLDIPDLIRSSRLSSEPNSDSGVVHSLPCTAA
jgi:hypothetical protein